MVFGASILCRNIATNRKVRAILALASIMLLTSCSSLPRVYSGERIYGWVVDAETKEPIERAVVVEQWALDGGHHSDHTANIHIAETITDKAGYYEFPAWGPKYTVDGEMNIYAPRLSIYKFGYIPTGRSNTVMGNLNSDNGVSEHSGKTIELIPHMGSVVEYRNRTEFISSVLSLASYQKPLHCTWEKLPYLSAEMIYLNQYFIAHKVVSGAPSIDRFRYFDCSDPEHVLKDYLREYP